MRMDDLSSFLDHYSRTAVPIDTAEQHTRAILADFNTWECMQFLGICAEVRGNGALTRIKPSAHHLGGRSGGQLVNGPMILSILDATMALVSLAHVHPKKVATINLNANFLHAVENDIFYCAAIATKRSSSLVYCEAIVFNCPAKTSTSASGVLAILRDEEGKPSPADQPTPRVR